MINQFSLLLCLLRVKSTSNTACSFSSFGASLGRHATIKRIGYLAIVHSNRNSEKTINQQYRLLQQQHKEKQLDEYNKSLVFFQFCD